MTIQKMLTILVGLTMAVGTTVAANHLKPTAQAVDSARTRVWWFFGNTETSRQGMTADLTAFKEQSIGGVVYYDQVHGEPQNADTLFSQAWWQNLIFAAKETQRLGLQFDAHITNGYAAGGRWITPDKAMQRLVSTEQVVMGGRTVKFKMPLHQRGRDYHHDVALLALPYTKELMGDTLVVADMKEFADDSQEQLINIDLGQPTTVRSITYEVNSRGKSATSAMQMPGPPADTFYGFGYRPLPDLGQLEASDNGVTYRPVANLKPIYTALGTWRSKTIALPTTRCRYFRIRLHDWHSTDSRDNRLRFGHVSLSARALVDQWEEKAGLQSEFIYDDHTPSYQADEILQADRIIDLTQMMDADGTVTWKDAPRGEWLVVRFTSVPTGGHTKHGRPEGLGLEPDKLSAEGAIQHWQTYVQPLIDTLRHHNAPLSGLLIDSHEAGSQNWTQRFPEEFQRLRGYDLRRLLPVMAGFVVGSPQQSHETLRDVRLTIADLVGQRYFATFHRLCRENGLTFTAQAIGGAVCMPADLIAAKQYCDRPQSEYWNHHPESTLDLKESSSAAHIYGKPIASAEAFTDTKFNQTPAYIKQLADRAYTLGINEHVACASGHQPWEDRFPGNTYFGRQYAFTRTNSFWPYTRGLWDYMARTSYLMRQGKPVSDLCVYLGDDAPIRILSHELPDIPLGFDYDAFTTDALLHRMSVKEGRITLPDGVSYGMMILPTNRQLTERAKQKISELRSQGACIFDPQGGQPLATALQKAGICPDLTVPQNVYFAHRRTATEDIYFIENHQDAGLEQTFTFNTTAPYAELLNPVNDEKFALQTTATGDGRTAINLTLAPRESFFVVFSHEPSTLPVLPTQTVSEPLTFKTPWTVGFDPKLGGAGEVKFERLADWTQQDDLRIRYYSGTAVYRNTFKVKNIDKAATYRLQLTLLNSAAEIYVNGQRAGLVWCSPWDIDVTRLLKKGNNKIEVRVANSWANRMILDASLPEQERVTWASFPIVKATDPLIPAGLLDVELKVNK